MKRDRKSTEVSKREEKREQGKGRVKGKRREKQ